jgi:hypothetical protein
MRAWQVERRKRTRHLIELGGLVVNAGIVHLTGDDRAMIYGALLWMSPTDRGRHVAHDPAAGCRSSVAPSGTQKKMPRVPSSTRRPSG